MSSLLEAFQAECRSIGGSAGTVNEDFHAAADVNSIPAGQWGERMLAYGREVDSTIASANAAFNMFLADPSLLNLVPVLALQDRAVGYILDRSNNYIETRT